MKYILLLLFSSCSLFYAKKELPKNELSKMSYSEMEHFLKQTETMAGKTFYITATPLTKGFVQKRIENKALYSLNKNLPQLLKDNTCFELDLYIDRPNKREAANFDNWEGYVLDSNGGIHFINWKKADQNITEVDTDDYFGKSVAYKNEALGCTDKLNISEGLTLHLYLKKSLTPWPFSEKVSLNWVPLKFKNTDNGKIFIEPKKKIKKKYRGW
ncbi:MAG: hypothetical protein OEY33_05930 [Bdellovibrionales bacterium]|nr:hypothetical protein [Bdellovibrionales bacterium]